ncbi:MAG: hypothetical protein HY747_07215 [Elusimicrobia bacterium]|nr:hypothetical protein [Elusimicrobiota bacterium]
MEDFEKILADSSPKEDRLIEAMNETAIGFLCSKQPDEQSLGASLQCLESLWISSPEPPQAVALRVIRVFADAVYELAAAKARVYSSRRKKDLRLASDLNRACYFWDWDGIEALYGVLIEAEFNVKKGLLPPEMAAHKFLRSFVATASVSDRPQGSAFSLGAGRISAP